MTGGQHKARGVSRFVNRFMAFQMNRNSESIRFSRSMNRSVNESNESIKNRIDFSEPGVRLISIEIENLKRIKVWVVLFRALYIHIRTFG